VPQQTPREAWDALLASLPIDDVQRRALTAAADDLALETASRVSRLAARRAQDLRSAVVSLTLELEVAVEREVSGIARESLERWRRTRGEP
jgi:hypothetical protein